MQQRHLARHRTAGVQRWYGYAVVPFLLMGALIAGLLSGCGPQPSSNAAEPSAPAASSAVSTPAAEPSAAEAADPKTDSKMPAAAPEHLQYEAAGLDMPVLPLTPTESDLANQSLVPPETTDAYWLTNYGKPGDGSKNTTYITGHSWEDRDAPFNSLSTEAEVGDELTLTTESGVLTYVVDSVTTHNKDSLRTSDIWDIVPNRLVIISCYTADLWGKNVVVTASPVP